MPAKRRPAAKKQEPAEQPAPQEEPTPVIEEQPAVEAQPEPAPAEEPVYVPDHVRQLARKVRQHIGNPRISFDAADGVPVMYGYNGLSHVVHGHPATHIATRDELSEMSEQEIYDRVMMGRQPPRQQYPIGGR